MKAIGLEPKLERALTEACLYHPSFATYLALGHEAFVDAYETEVPYIKRLGTLGE